MRERTLGLPTKQTDNASQVLTYNANIIEEFLIVGGELGLQDFYLELGVVLLVIYLAVLMGNLMILTLVILDSKLHEPMYIFLGNLAVINIVITSTVLPKMIAVCVMNNIAISYTGCFLQMYVYLSIQSVESFLLATMAYDRYVAVCIPLRYNTIISPRACTALVGFSWTMGLVLPAGPVIMASFMPWCNNRVLFWFCDYPPVVTNSCLDTTFLIDFALGCAIFIQYAPFTTIVWSYYKIIASILRITSRGGRLKTFSTCSSHLTTVLIYYFSHQCVYISAKSKLVPPSVLILISIINCVLTPVLNPIIYSLRSKDIRAAFKNVFKKKNIEFW